MSGGGTLMLELREPPADGRAKYWGKPDTIKFYHPTGRKDDGPWTQACAPSTIFAWHTDGALPQDVCWKGSLTREFTIAKNKKSDIDAGAPA